MKGSQVGETVIWQEIDKCGEKSDESWAEKICLMSRRDEWETARSLARERWWQTNTGGKARLSDMVKRAFMWRVLKGESGSKTQHPSQQKENAKWREQERFKKKEEIKQAPRSACLWLLPCNLPPSHSLSVFLCLLFCFLCLSPPVTIFPTSRSQKIFYFLYPWPSNLLCLTPFCSTRGWKLIQNSH